jgi:hypothetical protein
MPSRCDPDHKSCLYFGLRSALTRPIRVSIPPVHAGGFCFSAVLRRGDPPDYPDDSGIIGGIEMTASVLSFRAAVVMVIAGMIWGIAMGISQDHSTMPAHAHLNLLGWVSLFLFGTYYHLHPVVDRSRLASLQVWIWIVGTIILTIGVALVHSGQVIGEPIAAAASLLVLADALVFGWLVIRREPAGVGFTAPAK